MTHDLTAKQSEAIEYIDAYGNIGIYRERTRTSLVRRGLIESAHPSDTDAAYNYRVTAKGYALFSEVNRRHVNGRTVSDPNVELNNHVDTRVFNVVEAEEQAYRIAPFRAPESVTADEILHAIDNPPTVTELNERRNAEARPDAEVPVVSTPAYRIRHVYDGRTYLVLGTSPTTNAPHLTSLWVRREGRQEELEWTPETLMSDLVSFVAVDEDDQPQPAPIPFSTTHLYDRQQAQVLKVLGTGFGPTEFLAQTPGVYFRLPEGESRWFNWSTLLHGDRFVAACEHGMPIIDTCPACATVTEVITVGMLDPDTHPIARAAAAMSELTASWRTIYTNWRTTYTLDPTHTAACHLSEDHELCVRIPRGAPSDAVMPCVFEQRVAVRRWLVRQRAYAMLEGRTFAGKPVTDSDLSSL